LIVAAGDSGHAFKFTPVMGEVIADVVERKAERVGCTLSLARKDGRQF
jgi:glycine/D-amino acid oxidase-like deaminating enzyme